MGDSQSIHLEPGGVVNPGPGDNLELKALCNKYINCTKCAICKLPVNIYNPLKGYGKLPTHIGTNKILFIGINPSVKRTKESMDQGPFYGNTVSTTIFDKVLTKAGINKADCFITNLIKCSTPLNRMPTPLEMKNCRGFLLEELEIIKPQVVIGLGSLLNVYLELPNVTVHVMNHPSYLRYKDRNYNLMYAERLKLIREKYEKDNSI